MNPLVSIIITNFNKEKYLEDCLESCLNQTYKNFEICIADNDSTDGSLKIIKRYNKKIRIFNIKRKYKTGPQNQLFCIQNLIKKTKGKIICLLDSDDFFYKNKILEIAYTFNKGNIKFIFDEPCIRKQKKFIMKNKNSKHIWPTIFPTSSISFLKKEYMSFNKLCFLKNKKFNNLAVDFRIQVYSMCIIKDYKILKKRLTNYRQNPDGLESNWKKYSLSWWKRRYQAHLYLKRLYQTINIKVPISIDFLLSKMLNHFK
jgi:glycosyltransferase involved in cell wall biosynthesis